MLKQLIKKSANENRMSSEGVGILSLLCSHNIQFVHLCQMMLARVNQLHFQFCSNFLIVVLAAQAFLF